MGKYLQLHQELLQQQVAGLRKCKDFGRTRFYSGKSSPLICIMDNHERSQSIIDATNHNLL